MDYYKQEKCERVKLTGQELTDHVAQLPTTEERLNLKRQGIISDIYRISRSYIDGLQNGYSTIEAVRWEADKAAIEASDWPRFADRCGNILTPQQYAETRVVPKMAAGDAFIDATIAKRTDLIIALEACPGVDLASFDYTSVWDEVGDYTPPPAEEVETSWWGTLMASISWNKKLF